MQADALRGGCGLFHPVDVSFAVMLEELFEQVGQRQAAIHVAVQFEQVVFRGELIAHVAELGVNGSEFPAQTVGHRGRLEPATVGPAVPALPCTEFLKQLFRDGGRPNDRADRRFCVAGGEESTSCPAVVQRVAQVPDLVVREPRSEVLPRDFLERLGFVQDHKVVVRDDRRPLPA